MPTTMTARRPARAGAGFALLALALLALALAASPTTAAETCFRACTSEHITSADDDVAMREAMRACRDTCTGGEADALKAEGLYQRYAGCKAAPLSDVEFRKVRSGNPSFTVQSNVLVWQLTNVLPDKVIRTVEVGTQTMNLSDAYFTTRTLIPPGHSGTIVVMDFFDGYPTTRYAGKVTRIEACDAQ